MGNLSGESHEQNHKDKVTRFRSVTYARQLELLLNTLGSHLKANQHNEIQHSWFAVYLQKTLYFLVFHRDIGLKTSIYEFTERIHQNKQGFEGKKLSGKEFVAFEEYQRQTQPARRFLMFSYLDFRVYLACYPPESFKIICLTCIWSKSVDTSFHGHSSQPRNKLLAAFLIFQKKRVALR